MDDKLLETRQEEGKPLVTVVTITFNLIAKKREAYIKQCIESVHNQTYCCIEHIIIDGASNDGTLELLKQYQDRNYIKVYSSPDKGIYDAMNKGIARANGKYINFLNSDDFFHNKEAVKISVKYLEETAADYSFADAMLLYEDGKEYLWEGDVSKLLWGSHYCHQTMFVRTDLLKKVGGFDISYKISADTEMMIRLYAQKAIYVKVPSCIVSYRVGGYSSQNQLQSRIDHSTAFYKSIGKDIGLSVNDCFLCWNQSFFDELPKNQQLELILKIPLEYGQEYLLREFVARMHVSSEMLSNKWYYLFGFVPIVNCEYKGNKRYLRLFGILNILTSVEYKRKKKFYLLGVLPVLKVKRYI